MKQKKFIITLLIFAFMLTMLMACSSAASTEETKETGAVTVKEETTEVAEVKEEDPTPEPTAEPTPEPTAEPTPESVVYEGIDMESTLPGEEWILSFEGIINEPKLVVFNDSTNKKVIVEEGEEVEFKRDDSLGIYKANTENKVVEYDKDVFCVYNHGKVLILEDIFSPIWKKGSVTTKNIVEVDGEEIVLTATLVFVE